MQQYMKKRLILAKRETTYGTDPVPVVGTDAVLIRDLTVTPLDAQYADRSLIRPYYGRSDQLPTTAMSRVEIEIELAGMKALGVATAGFAALLRACGLAETVVASTSVAYAPISAVFDSVTIYAFYDSLLHKLTGARGTVSINLEAQAIPTFKFSFTGLWHAASDVTPGSPVFTDYKTPVVVNNVNTTALTVAGYASATLKSLSLDLANNVVFRSLVGGAEQVLLTDRQPAGQISIEATTVAAKDWLTAVRSATTGAFSVTHGPAGNRVKLDAPKVQLTDPKYSDQDGIAMLDMGIQFLPNTGNDELVITFL